MRRTPAVLGCNLRFLPANGTVKYTEADGAKGRRIAATEDLVPTIETAFTEGGVHLVAVPVDYSDNQRVLVDELRARVQSVAPN